MTRCVVCGREVARNHCWPCLAEENKVLREMLDEARDVARHLLKKEDDWAYLAELAEAYPWLKDKQT